MTFEQVSLIELAAKVVAIGGGITAALLAVRQWRDSVAQRRRELRWKQAEQGKNFIDEIYECEPSHWAAQMIEELERTYDVEGKPVRITHDQAMAALKDPTDPNSTDTFVRDCFDALFSFTERIEQYVRVELVTFDDVLCPADYLAERMAHDKAIYVNYLEMIKHWRTLQFLDRFPAWRDAKPISRGLSNESLKLTGPGRTVVRGAPQDRD